MDLHDRAPVDEKNRSPKDAVFSQHKPKPVPPAKAGLLLGGFLGGSVGSSLGGVCSSAFRSNRCR